MKEVEFLSNCDPLTARIPTMTATSRCLVVHSASLICTEEGIAASLYVNIEPEAIDQNKLRESLAELTNVSSSQIQMVIGPRNSTLVLLLLPPRAGMELLSIFMNSEIKMLLLKPCLHQFVHWKTVSVSVQINSLPSIKLFFVAKTPNSVYTEGGLGYIVPNLLRMRLKA